MQSILDWCMIILGFPAAVLLFFRIPKLPRIKSHNPLPDVSVVIPARNEAKTLPLLLGDLNRQTFRPLEILCVDDASEDDTANIAVRCGARLLSAEAKPDGWIGKSWAAQKGADAAHGSLLVFLDADVRLAQDGLLRIVTAYANGGTLSVQPFHRTKSAAEQLSLFFNLVQIAANGTALPRPVNLGLYGPVIAISRADYAAIGGHESVKSSIVEDMSLGEQLKKHNIPYRLFVGDAGVSFRMYPGGLPDLLTGWSKNLASGAAKTPVWLFAAVFFWLASTAAVSIQLIRALAAGGGFAAAALPAALYLGWVILLFVVGRRIGKFSPAAYLLYPVSLLVFFAVFAYSGFVRLFRLKVKWKGRMISLGR